MAKVRLSPSETLMQALEEIEGVEDVIIIWRGVNEHGETEVSWRINDVPRWRVLGLIECAKLEMAVEAAEGLEED